MGRRRGSGMTGEWGGSGVEWRELSSKLEPRT